ncbi:conserved hypothetical protein [Trichinella spiralis]|uniref:hypothetical protein n=1 Tax=Trichinella spiralis TaxID=6334 RepID=UPI0001EFE279|nr:conserved hypothetical protein [Trichinella spiralis]
MEDQCVQHFFILHDCYAGAVGNWDNSQAAFTAGQGHSFAKTLEHVVGTHASVKFLAYNNVPPGIPNVKTKSNSKGVIILSTAADSAAWVVHTIPGFPTAKTPYAWPASETARGHLLICLTISKSQINAIDTFCFKYFKNSMNKKISRRDSTACNLNKLMT